jgi:LPXTG-site transpeptidase (sortase) family protein
VFKKVLLVTPIYVLIGVLYVSSIIISDNNNIQAAELAKQEASIASLVSVKKIDISFNPVELAIPRLNLELPVSDGDYDIVNQKWDLSRTNAHFATNTNIPNNKIDGGLTMIYGHNTGSVFGKTTELEAGDILEVYSDDGKILSYVYEDSHNVEPNDTSLFEYEGKNRLVIMSCTGEWNELRRIMNFSFVSVRNI